MDSKKIQDCIWANSNEFQINHYYTMAPAVERSKWFAKQLKEYEFSSIYEPGIFSGRNLRYLADEFPDVRLGGFDINKTALAFAQKKVPTAELKYTDIYEMPTDDKWDLVFTMGVLIHIMPDAIEDIIKRCVEKANRYVMHIEAHGNNRVLTGPANLRPKKVKDKFQWEPNIKEIYGSLGYEAVVTELPDDLKTYGASHYIVVDLNNK